MKRQIIISLILAVTLGLGSCTKENCADSKLTGTWDIATMTIKSYTDGNLDMTVSEENLGSMVFNAAGDGSYNINIIVIDTTIGMTGTFEWYETGGKVFLTMNEMQDSLITKNLAIGFDVVNDGSDKQVWSMEMSYYEDGIDPSTGTDKKLLKRQYIEIELRKK